MKWQRGTKWTEGRKETRNKNTEKKCLFSFVDWNSVVGIATTLQAGRSGDRIPVSARFSAPVQTCLEAHPSCTVSKGSLPWG